MWGRLHHENNTYLRCNFWTFLFLFIPFFNYLTRFYLYSMALCLNNIFQSTFMSSSVPCWKNTSDLDGHCGPVSEVEGGIRRTERERWALWSRDAETGNRTQQRGTIGHPQTAQTGGVAKCAQKKCCVFLPPPVSLSIGLSLSSHHHLYIYSLSHSYCSSYCVADFSGQEHRWYFRTECARFDEKSPAFLTVWANLIPDLRLVWLSSQIIKDSLLRLIVVGWVPWYSCSLTALTPLTYTVK